MSRSEPAGPYASVSHRTLVPRTGALAAGALVILALAAAGLLLTGTVELRGLGGAQGEAVEFRQRATAIVDRFDALSASVNELLAEHERYPTSQSDPAWRGRFDAALAEARSLKAAAESLKAPEADEALSARLSEGLGLYATGLELLGTGFSQNGHGAYYFGSHGNWDLSLGATRLQECRQLLAAR